MLNGLYTLLSQPFGGALLGGVLLVLGGLVALAARRRGRVLRLVALAPALIGVVLTAMGTKGGLDQQRAMLRQLAFTLGERVFDQRRGA